MKRSNQIRTKVVKAIAANALLACACNAGASGQAYPERPVTIISPITAGASVDAMTRVWADCASQPNLANQPFVVMNRPGANGVVAAQAMRQVPADGYSIMVAGMSQTTITPYLFKKVPFDPLEDFTGIALYASATLTMVASPDSGIKTLEDIKQYADASGKGIDFGIPAIGTPAHLLGAAIGKKLGIDVTFVPTSGESNGVTSVIGNHIPVMIFVTGTAVPQVKSGKVTPIVTFTKERLAVMPDVPTVVEALGDSSLARDAWIGFTAKAGTPEHVIKTIEGYTKECMEDPRFLEALNAINASPAFYGHDEYRKKIQSDIDFFKPLIQELGIFNE